MLQPFDKLRVTTIRTATFPETSEGQHNHYKELLPKEFLFQNFDYIQ
jgi:hypothetical protein